MFNSEPCVQILYVNNFHCHVGLSKCVARTWSSIKLQSPSLRSCPIWVGHRFLWQSLLVGRLWEQGWCQEGLRCLEQGVWTGAIRWRAVGWCQGIASLGYHTFLVRQPYSMELEVQSFTLCDLENDLQCWFSDDHGLNENNMVYLRCMYHYVCSYF